MPTGNYKWTKLKVTVDGDTAKHHAFQREDADGAYLCCPKGWMQGGRAGLPLQLNWKLLFFFN